MSKRSQIVTRILADSILLILAAIAGFTYSFSSQNLNLRLPAYLGQQAVWIGMLLAISLPIFYFSGFYTKGRSYSSQYKPIFVGQIAVVSMLIWGAGLFLFEKNFGSARVGFIATSLIAVALIVGARIWSRIMRVMSDRDSSAEVAAINDALEGTKRVCVIGGAGYIGSGLLRKLLDRGYKVRLVDSFMFGESPISDLIPHPNLEVIKSDFRQIDVMVSAMRGMEAVVHLGAIVGDPACALDEDFTVEVNLMATRMIAECAKGSGIRKFIFASTCSVYGASDEILDEHSHLNPVSLYARSKIACEKILREIQTDTFRPTILRFGTVYGLSGRTRFDLVVNLLTAKAMVDGKITVFGEDQWRPFVHVDDASLAVATALESPLDIVGGEIFNVGSDEGNMTLGEVGRTIQRLIPTAELITSGSDGDRRNYRVDFSKIRKRLGFKPQWTVEKGIQQVMEAFNTGRVTDYNATEYSNVKYLTEEAQRAGLRTDIRRMRALVEEQNEDPISATNGAVKAVIQSS